MMASVSVRECWKAQLCSGKPSCREFLSAKGHTIEKAVFRSRLLFSCLFPPFLLQRFLDFGETNVGIPFRGEQLTIGYSQRLSWLRALPLSKQQFFLKKMF